MRYFVTGATGFIGGRLAQQLLESGHEVVALVRDVARARALADRGAELAQGDITQQESLRDPMRGVDGVFHLAAWFKVGARDTSPAYDINVNGTRNVLQLMQELNVPRGVYTSSLAVNSDSRGVLHNETYRYAGPWHSVYDRTKWQAQYEVAQPLVDAGLPLVIVMPGLVYGPGDMGATHDFLQDFLRRRLPMAPQRTAFCWGYVDDMVQAHILAMQRGKPGDTYIVGGPPHTMLEALEVLSNLTGLPVPRLRPGPAMLKSVARLMQIVGAIVPLPAMYSAETLRSIAGVTYLGDNAKARGELGFEPRALRVGMAETVAYEMRRLGMTPPSAAPRAV